MKPKSILLIIAVIFLIQTKAAILTVSNNFESPAQYLEGQEAVDAAYPGDTIIFAGSLTTYKSVYLTKKITMIGSGYNPKGKNILSTKMDQIIIQGEDAAGNGTNVPSGSRIIGFECSISIGQTNKVSISDILIQRCNVSSLYLPNANSLLIENNVLPDLNIANSSNIIVRNNILGNISHSNKSSVLFSNNVIVFGGSLTILYYVQYAIFTNNIMIGIVNLHESCTYNTFTHNITYPDPNTPSWDGELIVNANTGANNQIKVDPKFSYLEYDSRYDHANDYTLQPDSPAKNAGTDGTDIGVTGGSMPFFSLQGGTSPIPQILTVDVQNASVPKGGVLEVKVKAHVQK